MGTETSVIRVGSTVLGSLVEIVPLEPELDVESCRAITSIRQRRNDLEMDSNWTRGFTGPPEWCRVFFSIEAHGRVR